jgi:glycosyltransferase 2 family protein
VTLGKRYSAILTVARAVLGIVLLVSVLRSGGAWESLKGLLGFAWLIGLLNAVPFVGASIEALRLGVLFGAQGLNVPFRAGFRVVAIGTLFNLWIPGGTGGDMMKLYYLSQRHRGRGVEVATILVVDRAVALFALLVLIVGLILAQRGIAGPTPTLERATAAVLACLVILLGLLAAIWSPRIRASRAYQTVILRWPLGRYFGRAADAMYAFKSRTSALVLAGVYSLAGHLLLAVSFAIAGTVLVPGVPSLLVSTLSLLGLVANALPITPGGVGVGEAAAEALFRAVGVPGGAALVAAWRVGMIGVCIAGAGLYIFGDKGTRLSTPAGPLEKSAAPTHPLA